MELRAGAGRAGGPAAAFSISLSIIAWGTARPGEHEAVHADVICHGMAEVARVLGVAL